MRKFSNFHWSEKKHTQYSVSKFKTPACLYIILQPHHDESLIVKPLSSNWELAQWVLYVLFFFFFKWKYSTLMNHVMIQCTTQQYYFSSKKGLLVLSLYLWKSIHGHLSQFQLINQNFVPEIPTGKHSWQIKSLSYCQKARCYRLHIKNWENIRWDVQEQESVRWWVVLSSPEPRQTKFCKMEEQADNFISDTPSPPPCSFLCSLQMIVSWVVLLGLKFNTNIRHSTKCPHLEHSHKIKCLYDHKPSFLVVSLCSPTTVMLSLYTLNWSICSSREHKHPGVMNMLTLASLSLKT